MLPHDGEVLETECSANVDIAASGSLFFGSPEGFIRVLCASIMYLQTWDLVPSG